MRRSTSLSKLPVGAAGKSDKLHDIHVHKQPIRGYARCAPRTRHMEQKSTQPFVCRAGTAGIAATKGLDTVCFEPAALLCVLSLQVCMCMCMCRNMRLATHRCHHRSSGFKQMLPKQHTHSLQNLLTISPHLLTAQMQPRRS